MKKLLLLFLFISSSLHADELASSTFTRYGLEAAVVVLRQADLEPGADPAAKEVWLHLYFPPDTEAAPVVIILPMLGGRNLWVEEQLAITFAKHGMASVIVALPGQFERRTALDAPSGFLFLGRRTQTIGSNFAQAQKDVARVIAWLQGKNPWNKRLDPARMGIAGLSLGGILSSLAMAGQKEIKAGAFLIAGADPATIIDEGSLTKPIAQAMNISRQELEKSLRAFNLDGRKAAFVGRPVLLVEAIWDGIIPKSSRRKLRDAIPQAKRIAVPAGHITAGLHLFWVKERVARFLSENLESVNGKR